MTVWDGDFFILSALRAIFISFYFTVCRLFKISFTFFLVYKTTKSYIFSSWCWWVYALSCLTRVQGYCLKSSRHYVVLIWSPGFCTCKECILPNKSYPWSYIFIFSYLIYIISLPNVSPPIPMSFYCRLTLYFRLWSYYFIFKRLEVFYLYFTLKYIARPNPPFL